MNRKANGRRIGVGGNDSGKNSGGKDGHGKNGCVKNSGGKNGRGKNNRVKNSSGKNGYGKNGGGGNDRGSVTVFLIIITAGMLLFTSLLIDFSRIAAFNRKLDGATRAAVRSVLAAYDAGLYERYGLFARGGTPDDEIMGPVLEDWLNGPDGGHFRLLDARLVEYGTNVSQVLGDHDVFRRQVLEEMKYKAPIDLTLELASKLKPMSGAMKEAAAAVDLLERLRKLYERREQHLAAAIEAQREAANAAKDANLDSLLPLQGTAGLSRDTVQDVAAGYAQYTAWIAADASREEGTEPVYAAEIAAYERMARAVSQELRQSSMQAEQAHRRMETLALQELELARQINREMSETVARARTSAAGRDSGFVRLGESAVQGGAASIPAGAEDDLRQIRDTVDQLLLPDDWFGEFREEIVSQAAEYASFYAEAGVFQSSVSAALGGYGGDGSALHDGARRLQASYGRFYEKYIRPGTVIAARERALQSSQQVSREAKRKQAEADEMWKRVRGVLHQLRADPGTEEQREEFRLLEQAYRSNLAFNEAAAGSPPEAAGLPEEAGDMSGDAAGLSEGLFGSMADMLEHVRDPLYIGEYTIQRFSTFDPRNFTGFLGVTGPGEEADDAAADSGGLAEAFNLGNQEAEYILYGFHDPVANIAAAYGELFAFRLAIRTMEGLIVNKSLAHPLLILPAALLYGLKMAVEDMISFAREGAAPLSKYVPVRLTYADYLRLFMLLHGGDAGRLSRMIAVIERNTGTDLSRTPAGVSGEVRASVNLWFLPGLMRTINRLGVLEGKVAGNRYETSETIGWSY